MTHFQFQPLGYDYSKWVVNSYNYRDTSAGATTGKASMKLFGFNWEQLEILDLVGKRRDAGAAVHGHWTEREWACDHAVGFCARRAKLKEYRACTHGVDPQPSTDAEGVVTWNCAAGCPLWTDPQNTAYADQCEVKDWVHPQDNAMHRALQLAGGGAAPAAGQQVETYANEIYFKTEFRGAGNDEFCIDCVGQWAELQGGWNLRQNVEWRTNRYTFYPSQNTVPEDDQFNGPTKESFVHHMGKTNDLTTWDSTLHGLTPEYHAHYDVLNLASDQLPRNALLGRWLDDEWQCMPKAGYCARRYAAEDARMPDDKSSVTWQNNAESLVFKLLQADNLNPGDYTPPGETNMECTYCMGTWVAPEWERDAYTGWYSNSYLYQDILGMLSQASAGGGDQISL